MGLAMLCVVNLPLDRVDGLNPTRALILQAYFAMRRTCAPGQIGTRQVAGWIKLNEPAEPVPSDTLILTTLKHNKLVHRGSGRPRRDQPMPVPPLLLQTRHPKLHQARM